jgi:YD repeat-containing protein
MTYNDPLGRIWTHVTSGRRLRLRDIDPLGNRWSYSYLNYRPISMTDPLGRTTSFVYDANGLVIEVENALGNQWFYPRDEFGNILRVVDPLSRRTTLSYGETPEFRQPVTVMNALSEITTFSYLANGLLEAGRSRRCAGLSHDVSLE